MAPPTDLRAIFFEEAEELLIALDAGLRRIESGDAGSETVNAVFRAVHSIKGGAAAFGFANLVNFAHAFETLLDDLRSGARKADPVLVTALLDASYHLADMVAAERSDTPIEADVMKRAHDALIAVHDGGNKISIEVAFSPVPMEFAPVSVEDFAPLPLAAPEGRVLLVDFAPHADAFAAGHDPGLVLRDLLRLGLAEVTLDASALPAAGVFDPGQCFLRWQVRLTTDRDEADLRAVFDFIAGHCDLSIRAPEAEPVAEAPESVEAPPPAPAPQVAEPRPEPRAEAKAEAPPQPRATIRVDVDRVDRLVNVAGELVIHHAMLAEAIARSGQRSATDVDRSLDQLKQLSRQIQDSVMAIRAQPVKPLFDRMHRILREAASVSGKQARLVIEGETTEVDRTIIERLADPLIHMIRNSVDHGIEKPEVRRKAGKPETGVVTIQAAHRSGRIVITLSDDGGGINRDRVRQVAVDRGLIAPTADLTASEIDALLFLPGFSTATEVSALSGRGVGMDVLRSEITALGGRISIASQPGRGTALTITLPLTLAVMDGMVVEVAGQILILPVSSIVETLRPDNGAGHRLGAADPVVELRGVCLPLIDVGAALGFRDMPAEIAERIAVVVERDEKNTVALLVDAIHDQRQIVIKSLEDNYGHIPGIAAATVLGDGSVALILDPVELLPNRGQRKPQMGLIAPPRPPIAAE